MYSCSTCDTLISWTNNRISESDDRHLPLVISRLPCCSAALCSGFPLPPFELSSTPLAFSIQQSAGRPPGGPVEAVCKEVQHQAFCQTCRGLQVRRAHRRTTNKSRRRRDKVDSWEKDLWYAHTNISCIQNIKQNSPNTWPCLSLSVHLSSKMCLQGSVQAGKHPKIQTNLQLSLHMKQLHSPNIKTMHNGGCLCLMCVHTWKCLWIQRGWLRRDVMCAHTHASTDTFDHTVVFKDQLQACFNT